MDTLYTLLDDLDIHVNDAKKVPLLSGQYMVNRDWVLKTLQQVRDHLPDAVQDAHRVLESKAQMIEEAHANADAILAEAEGKANALLTDSQQRANKLLDDTQLEADQLYGDAERQANELVANAEKEAKSRIADAEREAKTRVSETVIMTEAERESSRMLTDAEREAARLLGEARTEAKRDRTAALEHCDELLKHAEDTAISIANELRNARMQYDRER